MPTFQACATIPHTKKTAKSRYTKLWRHPNPCLHTSTHTPTTHPLKIDLHQPVIALHLATFSLPAQLTTPGSRLPSSRQMVRHKALVQTFNHTSRASSTGRGADECRAFIPRSIWPCAHAAMQLYRSFCCYFFIFNFLV